MRLILLSLRYINDRPILNFDLTGLLTDFDNHNTNILEIKLPTGTVNLNKREYMNTWKIYEDAKNPKVFFIVAGYKAPNQDYAFKYLMEYAIGKINKTVDTLISRVDNLHILKERLERELVAA